MRRWVSRRHVSTFLLFALALVFCACDFTAAQTLTDKTPAANPAPVPSPQPPNATQPPAANPLATTTGQSHASPSQNPAKPSAPFAPCEAQNSEAPAIATGGSQAAPITNASNTTNVAGPTQGKSGEAKSSQAQSGSNAKHSQSINCYARFVNGPGVVRLSPEQKLRLAFDNLVNPFNLATIFGEAGIEIAANSHTAYGPGFPGWGRLSGVDFTQDMTDQFFGTFLVPTITHTDPHYHRRPDLSIPRRVLHCVVQVFWQPADDGKHSLNYSQIVAPVFDIAIANLYVPGQQTHFSADAERYSIGLATAPVDNFITEFVPTIASHIHTRVVFMQRIINHVAANPP